MFKSGSRTNVALHHISALNCAILNQFDGIGWQIGITKLHLLEIIRIDNLNAGMCGRRITAEYTLRGWNLMIFGDRLENQIGHALYGYGYRCP
ncbi:hypothetical protein D3C81_1965130 [compost metagenome]